MNIMTFFHYFMLFVALLSTVLYLFQTITTFLGIIALKEFFKDVTWVNRLVLLIISIVSWLVLHHEGVLF